MKKSILIFFLLSVISLYASDEVKNPWYVDFSGNKLFSTFQLTDQLDVPTEFGQMDTTKQDFLMKLAKEGLTSL